MVKSRGLSQMSKFINSEEAKAFMEKHPVPRKLRQVNANYIQEHGAEGDC
jgi:hypothetical protein